MELIRKTGGRDNLIELRQDHQNDNLADLVLNRNELHKVVESKHKLIRKMEPVYQIPASRNGRAPFYSAVKVLGNNHLDTFWFNVFILWIMSLMLYISLRFSWLKKIIEFNY